MAPKRKVAELTTEKVAVSKRKENGIKGITVAQKSNDPLRDKLITTLRASGIVGSVESKIVFAHTGIYIGGTLFGWVGQGTGFSIRCNNAKQKSICAKHGCEVMVSNGHKGDNYYLVTTKVQNSPVLLRALAEEVIAAAPAKKEKVSATRKK